MTTKPKIWIHLAPNPKSSYKQLYIRGTRIPARALYGCYASLEPRTPEEIAGDYGLPVDAVVEAIAYCESNPPELLADYAREARLVAATGMDDPNSSLQGQPKSLSPQERAKIMGS